MKNEKKKQKYNNNKNKLKCKTFSNVAAVINLLKST